MGANYQRFLMYLSQGEPLKYAAELAGFERSAVYKRVSKDSEFRAAVSRARDGQPICCHHCGEKVS